MPKLLVADDEFDLRIILQELFSELGYEVFLSTNGAEAIELAHRELPDVIVMDIHFEGGGPTGLEATQRLKAAAETKEIPIIIITGAVMSNHDKAYAAGCNDHWGKGTNFEALIEKVEMQFRSKGSIV